MRITHTSKKFSRNFSKVQNQTHTLLYKPVFWWSVPDNLIESSNDSRKHMLMCSEISLVIKIQEKRRQFLLLHKNSFTAIQSKNIFVNAYNLKLL